MTLYGVVIVKQGFVTIRRSILSRRRHFIHGGLVERSIEGRTFLEHNQLNWTRLSAEARQSKICWLRFVDNDFYHEVAARVSETDLKTAETR